MNRILVAASTPYYVQIGQDLLGAAGSHIAQICSACKAAIISDSNVFPIYGQTLTDSLKSAGFDVYSYVFPAGESSKNANTYLNILSWLAQNTFTRKDILIALGGGVVGDMTGFTAATYLRGVDYIQIPTSLLAMVDSSVGGKTAIDLPEGKNLVGAFYQPKLVLCDLSTLNTLPRQIFCDGCAEVIKYSMLYDEKLFDHLMEYGTAFHCEYVIPLCIQLKSDVVQSDEFDRGARQQLNFGHTVGHSIESLSGFTVSHGQAVAAGMAILSKAAAAQGYCQEDVYGRLRTLLQKFALPTETEYSAQELSRVALSDKKRSADTLNLIIPERIGQCRILPIQTAALKSFIEAGV